MQCARQWIQRWRPADAGVVSVILQHVQERSANLERRPKSARVVPIEKDGAAAPDARIQAARQAHGKPLHRARKRALSFCFNYQVNVVRLDGELNQACTEPPFCRAKRRKHERSECPLPQTRQPSTQPHRDVQRVPLLEFRTAHVRHACLVP
jgi:hypothetical protein